MDDRSDVYISFSLPFRLIDSDDKGKRSAVRGGADNF